MNLAVPVQECNALLPSSATWLGSPLPGKAVREQLSKILESAGFARAVRMKRFLEFIVAEALAGRACLLCEYSIAISVFERDESFEPGLDPIVRNDARRLRQKLFEYYQAPRNPREEQVIIEVPKGGYAPVFSLPSTAKRIHAAPQYRLSVSVIRVTDGSEIVSRAYDLEGQKFSLQFQLDNLL